LRLSILSAADGRSRIQVLRGEPGSGKTALLRAACVSRPEGMTMLSAAGHRIERDLPYAGLHQLLAPLRDRIMRLPPPHRGRLARALVYQDGDAEDAMAVAVSLLWLLSHEAETNPVLVVVDDAHWLDRSSQRALVFVARRLDADAICLMLGVRPVDDEPFSGLGETIEVDGLADDDARELLRSVHDGLATEVAERLVQHAGGLPLALIEMPSELTEAQRTGSEPLPTRLPLGGKLDRLYRHRLARLMPRTRAALALVSLSDLDRRQLDSVLPAAGSAWGDLEEAECAGLIDVDVNGCHFRHPTLRVAAQHAADAAQVRAFHAVLAELPRDDPVATAIHLHHSAIAPCRRAEAALCEAARWAGDRGGWAEAATLWTTALAHATHPATMRDYRAHAVRAHLRVGSGPAALVLLGELVGDARDDVERAQWRHQELVARMWTEFGLPYDVDALVGLAERLCGGDHEAASVGVRLLATVLALFVVNGEVRAATRVVAVLRSVPGEGLSLPQQLFIDWVGVMAGEPGAGQLMRSNWVDELTDRELSDHSLPIGIIGLALGWLDEIDGMSRVSERLSARLEAEGARTPALTAVWSMRALASERAGDWTRAEHEFTAAVQASVDSDFAAPYSVQVVRLAYHCAIRGDQERSRAMRAAAWRHAGDRPPFLRHLTACVEGMEHLVGARFELAVEVLDEAAQIEREIGLVARGHTSRFVDWFESMWALGRADGAEDELARFEATACLTRHPTERAMAARCRGLLADPDGIDGMFEVAVRLGESSPNVFERARTRLRWGQRLRRVRRKGDAATQLGAAWEVFDALGATPWAELARSELAACGHRRVTTAPTSDRRLATLTPREFEVASAVASGLTNIEAAQQLVISRRTVEYHLASAYRKLSVNDRHELAEVFRRH
jgi:DNA-binding CsgD family transcriptional regulator